MGSLNKNCSVSKYQYLVGISLALCAALLTIPACSGGAAKTKAAKQLFAVSQNTIVLNRRSAEWPLTSATARSMLGPPDRTTEVFGEEVFTWDKHGVTFHVESDVEKSRVIFWFHDCEVRSEWAPRKTVKAVVVNGVEITADADPADLQKAGMLQTQDSSSSSAIPKDKRPMHFTSLLGRATVVALYNPAFVPYEYYGGAKKGLETIVVESAGDGWRK